MSFIKLIRSEETRELIKRPNELTLLTLIALRAKRTDSFSIHKLEPGEALIGDHDECGLTRQQYRSALKNLKEWEIITTRTTNRGTIAKILNSNIFEINIDTANHQNNQQSTISQPSANHQSTTNKNDKNIKNEKNEKNNYFPENSYEFQLSKLLFDSIQQNDPAFKKPDFQKWSTHINRLIRDGRSPETIHEVIEWCQNDSFWQGNILSTQKLRKQFSALLIKMPKHQHLSKKTQGNVRAIHEAMEELKQESERKNKIL